LKQPTTKASSDIDSDVDRGSDCDRGSDSDDCGRIDYIFIINQKERKQKKK